MRSRYFPPSPFAFHPFFLLLSLSLSLCFCPAFCSLFSVVISFYSLVRATYTRTRKKKKFALSMVKYCSGFSASPTLLTLPALGRQLPVPNLHMFDIRACHSWYPDRCSSKWLWHDTSKFLPFFISFSFFSISFFLFFFFLFIDFYILVNTFPRDRCEQITKIWRSWRLQEFKWIFDGDRSPDDVQIETDSEI